MNPHVNEIKLQPVLPLYLSFVSQSNTKTGLKQWTFFYWEILLSIFLIYVQGAILDSTKALGIITFGVFCQLHFPRTYFS